MECPKVRIDAVCEIMATAPPGLSASPGHLQELGERWGDLGC